MPSVHLISAGDRFCNSDWELHAADLMRWIILVLAISTVILSSPDSYSHAGRLVVRDAFDSRP